MSFIYDNNQNINAMISRGFFYDSSLGIEVTIEVCKSGISTSKGKRLFSNARIEVSWALRKVAAQACEVVRQRCSPARGWAAAPPYQNVERLSAQFFSLSRKSRRIEFCCKNLN